MEFITCDVGGKIDKGAMCVFKETGDYKAPVPQNAGIKLVETKPFEYLNKPLKNPIGIQFAIAMGVVKK